MAQPTSTHDAKSMSKKKHCYSQLEQEADETHDEDSSPDSERFHSTDVDSGNSTAHSPDGPKSMSPQLGHQVQTSFVVIAQAPTHLRLQRATFYF
ncbi:hypothetical protein C0J52_10268 [Blattella germanica]|nr:hypothetical protein C0J52_10268 [Blattella germanica]